MDMYDQQLRRATMSQKTNSKDKQETSKSTKTKPVTKKATAKSSKTKVSKAPKTQASASKTKTSALKSTSQSSTTQAGAPKTQAGAPKLTAPKTSAPKSRKDMAVKPKTSASRPAVAKAKTTAAKPETLASRPAVAKAKTTAAKPETSVDSLASPNATPVSQSRKTTVGKPETSASRPAVAKAKTTAAKPETSAGSTKTVIDPEAIMYYQDLTPGEPKKSPFFGTQLTSYKQNAEVQKYIRKHSKAKLYMSKRPVIPREQKVAGWGEDVPYILSREASQELPSFTFVGRQSMFEMLEDQRASARHTALIGMRKMGKTTFIKRYYDYLFCTSNEVIPFFYSFMNLDEKRGSKKSVIQVAEKMMITFLSQAIGFLTQNKQLANNTTLGTLLEYLDDLDVKYKELYYKPFHNLIQRWYGQDIQHPLYRMMQRSIDLTLELQAYFNLSPVIMLDEYQEIGRSFVDENGESYDCVPMMAEYHCNEKIFIVLSGSGLTTRMEEALPPAFEYRIERIPFGPLEKEESKELMRRTMRALKIQGYDGIEDFLYDLVDGNPYFMRSIFARSLPYEKLYGKKKDFTSKPGVEQAYAFECGNAAGKIYDFWHWYLIRNWQAYPTFIKFGKDIYQILEFLVNRAKRTVFLENLQKHTKKTVEELIPILAHLERIDLIQWEHIANVLFITKEPTIVTSIRALKYTLFYPNDPFQEHREENLRKHVQEIVQRMEAMEKEKADMADQIKDIEANVDAVQTNVDVMQANLKKMHDEIMSLRGSLNYEKGMEAEEVIRGRIQRREEFFAIYPVVGDVRNQKILDPITKQGYELDCVCDLDPTQLPLSDLPIAKIDYASVSLASNAAGTSSRPLMQQAAALASAASAAASASAAEPAAPAPAASVAATASTASAAPAASVVKCKGMLVVEVKKLKQKISLAQAQHFIKGLQALQRLYGLTQIYAMYYAHAGFSKTAAGTLMQHNIMVIEYAEASEKEKEA